MIGLGFLGTRMVVEILIPGDVLKRMRDAGKEKKLIGLRFLGTLDGCAVDKEIKKVI